MPIWYLEALWLNWGKDLPEIAETLGADMVLINGKIITVDAEDSIGEAVAVKYGRIAKVGTNEEVRKLITPETEVVDLDGKCVTPGFITTHEHFLRYGYNALSGIDLWYPRMKSIEDIKRAVTEKVKTAKPGEWIFGWGWDENLLKEKRYPNRYDLDEVAPDNPVYLGRVYQMVASNSLAMRIAGVIKESPEPEYGNIFRDEQGEPTYSLRYAYLDSVR